LAASACATMLALAGCEPAGGPVAPAASAAPTPSVFPTASGAYVARLKVYDDGVERALTVYADGGRVRIDGPPPPSLGAPVAVAVVFDPTTGKTFAFRQGEGAPKIAIVVEPSQFGAAGVFLALDRKASANFVGADQVAGLACQVWRFDGNAGDVEGGRQICVTEDGVILRVSATATPANPLLQAETITRGTQATALFALPAGYELIDYAPCSAMASEAMTSAHAGQPIDKSKLAECETLGQKASRIFAAQ
jgi:hypothetical protein